MASIHRSFILRAGPLPLVSALAAACAGSQSALSHAVVDTVGSGVPRVMSAGPTAWSDTNGWKLMYERTVQPPEGSPGMLTDPSQIILLPDGSLIVSQRDPVLIKLFDSTGTFVRNIARQGPGPAEFQSPKLARYGDTLVIHDGRQGRATIMVNGNFVRDFRTDIFNDGPPISVDEHGRLRVQNSRPSVGRFQAQWVHFDLRGNRLDSLLPPEAVEAKTWEAKIPGGAMSVNVPFAPQNAYAFLADGSVLYGGQDRYEFFVTRDGVDTTRIFGRSGVAADPIPTALRDSMIARYASEDALRGIFHADAIPHDYGLWNEFAVDGAGDVWVSRGRRTAGTLRFDVFNPAGDYLGAVAPTFDTFWRTSWTGDRVAVVDADSTDLPRIRIFRIERPGQTPGALR